MTCDCNKDRIEILVKQGTSLSCNFTVYNKDGTPLLLNDYTISVQVKKYPLAKVNPIRAWEITTGASEGGQITSVDEGKFRVTFTSELTTSLNPDTYYLVIMQVNPDNRIIISGEGDKSGVLRICRQ